MAADRQHSKERKLGKLNLGKKGLKSPKSKREKANIMKMAIILERKNHRVGRGPSGRAPPYGGFSKNDGFSAIFIHNNKKLTRQKITKNFMWQKVR